MVVSLKDGLRLFGVSVICFCAVFVCTFFSNFYIDVKPLKDTLDAAYMPLYEAQLATATAVMAACGGVLGVVALVTLFFYIRTYTESRSRLLGIVKAMGYSAPRIAAGFAVFGASVFAGCVIGYACGLAAMPAVYRSLTMSGLPTVKIGFHPSVPLVLIVAPTLVFSAAAVLGAYVALKRPVRELLSGRQPKYKDGGAGKDRSFKAEVRAQSVRSKKLLTFFVAFSCFCFSAMVQMGMSMDGLTDGAMSSVILVIGLVIAAVTLFMSVSSLVGGNAKSLALMKAFGYNKGECLSAVLLGFLPFAALGFAVGTVYQFLFLKIMVNIVFKDVDGVTEYVFNYKALGITVAGFVAFYGAAIAFYAHRIGTIPIRIIAAEE